MTLLFNIAIILILILYTQNGYFLSIKQNIIKLSSFFLRLILAWILANILSKLVLGIKISNENYEYIINGEVIENVTHIVKVILIQKLPNFTYIIKERNVVTYIIESISGMLIRVVLFVLIYLIITIIYKIIALIIKKRNKKRLKPKAERSHKKGLIFGLFQGILVVLMICIPISGASEIINEAIRLDENVSEIDEIKFFKNYRNTLIGKTIKQFNINNKPIDLYFFDYVFFINMDDSKIYLSEEVRSYIDILEFMEVKEFKMVDENFIETLDKDFINELILKLSEVKSLNISAPLLIDYFLVNYYKIILEETLYEVDYYNDLRRIGDLVLIYLYEVDKLEFNDLSKIDVELYSRILDAFSNLDLLDKLTPDITKELINGENIQEYLEKDFLGILNLSNVNYKKEVTLIRDLFNLIIENEDNINYEVINELSLLVSSSNLLMDNNEVLLGLFIEEFLKEYDEIISRLPIKIEDIRSLIIILKAYLDNGFTEPYFRLSKLYDADSIDIVVNAIVNSDLLINNLSMIFKLYLVQSSIDIDFNLYIPKDYDFRTEEGKEELKKLLRLFQIINYGINQENLEKHLDEICDILENSIVIKENINNLINWGISKYNTTDYNVYVQEIDFLSLEGERELNSLINILKLAVDKRWIELGGYGLFELTKEDIDLVLSSRLIEEASIHLLYDLGKGDDVPIVVNFEVNDPAWYKSDKSDGELRNLLYAVKIIFKDVEKVEDIKFTTDLILSIDDGTIDTNSDGVIDDKDENELYEIMKSKILSDSVIKFVYDYLKKNKKIGG